MGGQPEDGSEPADTKADFSTDPNKDGVRQPRCSVPVSLSGEDSNHSGPLVDLQNAG